MTKKIIKFLFKKDFNISRKNKEIKFIKFCFAKMQLCSKQNEFQIVLIKVFRLI